MKLGSLSLYYNSDFGYILGSETKIDGTIINTIINPVVTKNNNISDVELGEAIRQSLEISKNAKPMERSEIKDFKFWRISKINSFKNFSKKFSSVDVTQKDNLIIISKMKRESDGSYSYPGDASAIEVPSNLIDAELGKIIRNLLTKNEPVTVTDIARIETVHLNIFTYSEPSEKLNDIGDRHTDAYQFYVDSENDLNYIGFIIDSGYKSFDEKGIKKRWEEMYPNLEEFEFNNDKDKSYNFHANAVYDNIIVESFFFQDGEGYLEVMFEVAKDKVNFEEDKQEFEKIVNSVTLS
ncbi:MAG: contact-dependent growth inhibition system immunity protein [Erysipelothrix sp.]